MDAWFCEQMDTLELRGSLIPSKQVKRLLESQVALRECLILCHTVGLAGAQQQERS
jgi:hypothetical protein